MPILLLFFAVVSSGLASDELLWRALFDQASELRDKGNFVEARSMFQKCVNYAESLGANDPRLAFSLTEYGYMEMIFGKNKDAEAILRRAVRILEFRQDTKLHLAHALNHLGQVYFRLDKRYKDAERVQRRALALAMEDQGSNKMALGSILANLAITRSRLGDYPEAKALCERAMSLIPENDPFRPFKLGNLAMISYEWNDFKQALRYLEESVAGIAAQSGPRHPDLIAPLYNLAQTYLKLNFRPNAEIVLRRALVISDLNLGEQDQKLPRILESLAELRRMAGDKKEAKEFENRARRIETNSDPKTLDNALVHVSELMEKKRK